MTKTQNTKHMSYKTLMNKISEFGTENRVKIMSIGLENSEKVVPEWAKGHPMIFLDRVFSNEQFLQKFNILKSL